MVAVLEKTKNIRLRSNKMNKKERQEIRQITGKSLTRLYLDYYLDEIKIWYKGGKKYYVTAFTRIVEGKELKEISSYEQPSLKRRIYLFFYWLREDIRLAPMRTKYILIDIKLYLRVFLAGHFRLTWLIRTLPDKLSADLASELAFSSVDRHNELVEKANKEIEELNLKCKDNLEFRYKKLKLEEELK